MVGLFAALAFALFVYGVMLAGAVGSGAWFRQYQSSKTSGR
jgi:hypothetical protein